MASIIKSKLKKARDALEKKDFSTAKDAAVDVLSYEPGNYNANVFLGLAFHELKQYEQSEQAYRNAINANAEQVLAWQGLSKLFEQSQQLDKYAQSLHSLLQLYAKSEDATRCAEALQRLLYLRRKSGSANELIDTLHMFLPGSPYYEVLLGLPPPDPTAPTATTTFVAQSAIHNSLPVFEEIIEILEKDEEMAFQKEVDKRRMRLGAPGPDVIRREVGRELWSKSKLSYLYNEVLHHPNTSDELRRSVESKLLRYKQRYQQSMPNDSEWTARKTQIGEEIDDLINGIVLLNIPNLNAWTSCIEACDCERLEDYDVGMLKRFTDLFHDHPMSRLINGYLLYFGIALGDDHVESVDVVINDVDPFDEVLNAANDLQHSIFAHRALSDIYYNEKEYQYAIASAEAGLTLVDHLEVDRARQLPKTRKALNVILANSLVNFYPPKHHKRATLILDEILEADPDNVSCMMGRAHIYQEANCWSQAALLFEKVAMQRPILEHSETILEAREEHGWCNAQLGNLTRSIEELQSVLTLMEKFDTNARRKARVWWRLGQCYWKLGAEYREEGYRHFITALKRSPEFAPAFTSLGIYYSDFATPADPKRATKCFQKAFELDIREAEAAKRLADSFAEDREWDLVKVIARRTIEGEGGLDGGLADNDKTAAARFRPTNTWAWKALGIVYLSLHKYTEAIDALQTALRGSQNDALVWLRLGEAYTKAGRHTAALRALLRSKEMNPDDWLCSYWIGEVQRQTDQLPEAIETYRRVLQTRPSESGVLAALSETMISQGRSEKKQGFVHRAEATFIAAVKVVVSLLGHSPDLRHLAWKTLYDVLMELSEFDQFVDPDTLSATLAILTVINAKVDDNLAGIVESPLLQQGMAFNGYAVLKIGVVICSLRLTLHPKEDTSVSSAWLDLGVALFKLAATTLLQAVKQKASAKALDAVQQALVLEPHNPAYWVAFGNLNAVTHPAIAQHSYIKALEIDDKDPTVWTHLGLLYVQNQDLDLADEAFHRAQVLDPDDTLAWVGLGLVALEQRHDIEAEGLFQHAVGLSSDIPAADLEFARQAFHRYKTTFKGHAAPSEELQSAFYCLYRYCRQRLTDPSAFHLFALVCEYLGHADLAAQMITRSIDILESVYEETEDPVIERRYTICNANLGRLKLANQEYQSAIDAFETSYGLLAPDGSSEDQVILRALCQLGCGIAQFHLQQIETALACFEAALDITPDAPLMRGQVIVILAQTLWSIGSEECRDTAKNRLLESLTMNPNNLEAVTSLLAMAIATSDDPLLDAALSEILSHTYEERRKYDPVGQIENLLVKYQLIEGKLETANNLVQEAVHTDPTRQSARQNLASAAVHRGRVYNAVALLSPCNMGMQAYLDDLPRSLRIASVAGEIGSEDGNEHLCSLRLAQRAVMLAPWNINNWRSFAYICNAS